MSSSSKIISFECDVCQKKFSHRSSLRKHLIKIHSLFPINKCVECNEIFETRRCLMKHMRAHKESIRFNCNICDKNFTSKDGVKEHMSLHFPVLVSCNVCQKTFTRKSYLRKHLNTHCYDPVLLSCNICQKTFTRKRNLTKHLITHSYDKPFNCDHCGKKFKTKQYLKIHILNHTK